MNSKIISVFGSARPDPESADYQDAYEVGRLLAEAGYAVATGGYMGTMEAVSKGAHDAGGHVIGITSDQIEAFRPLGPNGFIKQETRYTTLRERLLHLVHENDAMIALPGGIGTLAEVAMAWNAMQTGEMPVKPFVLLGNNWRSTLIKYIDPAYVHIEDAALLHYASSPEQAVKLLITLIETSDNRPQTSDR